MFKAFYSDPHFGHKNIIKFSNRPFRDVDHMNRGLIERYNAVISKSDTVMWLGDCAFCKPEVFHEIMNELNGNKSLVLGNHDRSAGVMSGLGFDLVLNEGFMKIAEKTCRLSHYPYLNAEPPKYRKDDRFKDRRPQKVKDEVLIHGHTHSSEKVFQNMIHIGCDAWDYKPAMLTEVEELIRYLRL